MTIRFLLASILICCSLSPVLAQDLDQSSYEQSLLQAIQDIQHLNHDQALADTREFIRQYPTSKIGRLLYADLLLAKADILPTIGYGLQSKSELNDLTFEIRQRLSNQQALAYAGYLPENLISLSENQPYVLVMDQSLSRVYVYRNEQGMPVLETDYFLSIGLKGFGKQKEGDKKTPIGVYHVTSYIDGEKLPDLYGEGAFPVNYPNVWDKRNQRTGSGIWIHGTPSHTYNRAPWSSDGCMVVSNPDFASLARYIDPLQQTPVIVVEQVNWITPEQWRDNQRDMLQLLTRWIEDWESNDLD
ncbi:MAG: L,D-transpeptidase family protein, partial [Gammaproteobacteria bacterium]|nr:L,D-transpeptidase family protein [Gammaproteobacteria bacterium]